MGESVWWSLARLRWGGVGVVRGGEGGEDGDYGWGKLLVSRYSTRVVILHRVFLAYGSVRLFIHSETGSRIFGTEAAML